MKLLLVVSMALCAVAGGHDGGDGPGGPPGKGPGGPPGKGGGGSWPSGGGNGLGGLDIGLIGGLLDGNDRGRGRRKTVVVNNPAPITTVVDETVAPIVETPVTLVTCLYGAPLTDLTGNVLLCGPEIPCPLGSVCSTSGVYFVCCPTV